MEISFFVLVVSVIVAFLYLKQEILGLKQETLGLKQEMQKGFERIEAMLAKK